METEGETRDEEVKKSYSKLLSRHGYGFQYSVLNVAHKLAIAGDSSWLFEASEFPVEVKGFSTRIDFILKRRGDLPFFLLAECKRANPALSNWCFVRAPFIHRHRHGDHEPVILEHAESGFGAKVTAYAKERLSAHNPCQTGLEVRSRESGDSQGESGRAIEDACTQILRGLNGEIEILHKHGLANLKRADFLPVVFTTAQLWYSDVDLKSADIESGTVDLTNSNFSRQPWVSYQYHQSPGIKHSASPVNVPSDLGKFMNTEYIRTIAIVSPAGIASFLGWASEFDLYD